VVKKLEIDLEKEHTAKTLKSFIIKMMSIVKSMEQENIELRAECKELKKRLHLSPESPTAPSSAQPNFLKPNTKKRHRKPGRKKGHKGTTGESLTNQEVTECKEHVLNNCPDCGQIFHKPATSQRQRIIVDIKLTEKLDVTQHNIDQSWCSNCKEMKEDVITDALAGFTVGIKTVIYTALQHYYHGISISKILQNLKIHGMTLTEGALVGQWHALAKHFKPLYNNIGKAIKDCKGAVHADETGHRQKGIRHWLWSFSTRDFSYFVINRKRSGKVVLDVFGSNFGGILITDFWKPYLATNARLRQWCVAHYLREFKKVEFKRANPPPEYFAFRKKVLRLFKDALRFSKQEKLNQQERISAHKRFLKRLDSVVLGIYTDPDVKRLVKRLKTYRDGFFTFVAEANVDATNNYAERMIRFAVIMRKVSLHTMSEKGSETMAILLSVFKTIELQNQNVFRATIELAKTQILNQSQAKSTKINLAA